MGKRGREGKRQSENVQHRRMILESDMVVHAYKPCTWEAEAGGS
jgi:hypothetical protein